jgi:carbamoyltransferase
MYILGISCYFHDSAACLLKDGNIVAAAEEERFTRIKHDNSFPINAINYCLKEAKITSERLSYVVFYEKPFQKFERILQTCVETFPHSFKMFRDALPQWIAEI